MKYLFFIALLSFTSYSTQDVASMVEVNHSNADNIKEQAFEILKTKCNVCHKKKNKRMVFTLKNMNRRAKKINRQVFKWKRMPKGDEIKLTKEEYTILKTWILNR